MEVVQIAAIAIAVVRRVGDWLSIVFPQVFLLSVRPKPQLSMATVGMQ